MARVKINGTWLIEENEIRDGMVNAFKVLLSTARNWRPDFSGLSFARLEEPLYEEEVFEALKGFSGDKAPFFLWLFGSFLGGL